MQASGLKIVTRVCFYALSFSVVSSVRMWVERGWQSTGRGVVRVSCIHTAKTFSEKSGRISAKFCTSKTFIKFD